MRVSRQGKVNEGDGKIRGGEQRDREVEEKEVEDPVGVHTNLREKKFQRIFGLTYCTWSLRMKKGKRKKERWLKGRRLL